MQAQATHPMVLPDKVLARHSAPRCAVMVNPEAHHPNATIGSATV